MKSPHDSDTVELEAPPPSVAVSSPAVPSVEVRVELAGLSHRGHVRINNEDAFVLARAERALHTLATSLPQDDVPRTAAEIAYGMVVADGMGGHAAGEVASRVALTALIRDVLETPDWIMRADERQAPRIEGRIAEHYDHANQAVNEEARADPRLRGMGTTMTAAFSFGPMLFLGHVGDSRAYLLRGGQIHKLTRDHSFAQALVDSGVLQPEQAKSRGVKNILLRYLGTSQDHIATDVRHLPLENGDQLLLCTDGLTDMIDDAAIASVLSIAATPTAACQALIDAALDAGGKDNVTVALARYRW
jgi:PPM family protein phosphatase